MRKMLVAAAAVCALLVSCANNAAGTPTAASTAEDSGKFDYTLDGSGPDWLYSDGVFGTLYGKTMPVFAGAGGNCLGFGNLIAWKGGEGSTTGSPALLYYHTGSGTLDTGMRTDGTVTEWYWWHNGWEDHTDDDRFTADTTVAAGAEIYMNCPCWALLSVGYDCATSRKKKYTVDRTETGRLRLTFASAASEAAGGKTYVCNCESFIYGKGYDGSDYWYQSLPLPSAVYTVVFSRLTESSVVVESSDFPLLAAGTYTLDSTIERADGGPDEAGF